MSKDSTKRKHAIFFDPEGKITRGSFKEEVDVNNIVDRFTKTGELPKARFEPQYGDSPNKTLHEAACVIADIASQMEEGLEISPEKEPEVPQEPEKAPETPDEGSEEASPEGAQ